ncbi:E3 ubiquitin-protein ligase ZNRF2 [Varanus komodoensis]|nr:E3 ubiquitin-protein ligase ZNRF2 [Varanus komodoensis]
MGEQRAGFKCPVCSKFVSSDEMDLHLVMCLTKPRITYNEDVLSKDAGECAICLEELQQGDTIARLPCLCIYHKGIFMIVDFTEFYELFSCFVSDSWAKFSYDIGFCFVSHFRILITCDDQHVLF